MSTPPTETEQDTDDSEPHDRQSATNATPNATEAVGNTGDPLRSDQIDARLQALEAENRRLREEYNRSQRRRYRSAAIAMAAAGLAACGGAVLFPGVRTVLLALGGTGLFGAMLIWFLTPERFVPERVGQQIHDAHASNQSALIDDLGLQEDRVYVPADSGTVARLFLPQRASYDIPDSFDGLLVVPNDERQRGVAFEPTGARLYDAFKQSLVGEPATDPAALAAQLADGVVETFELADSATVDADRSGGGIAVAVDGAAYGALSRPDHPVVSLLATGLAVGLDRPVRATVEDTDRAAALVVCRWDETEE